MYVSLHCIFHNRLAIFERDVRSLKAKIASTPSFSVFHVSRSPIRTYLPATLNLRFRRDVKDENITRVCVSHFTARQKGVLIQGHPM